MLVAAAASLALSISLYFAGNDQSDKLNGIYVGVWVPSILALGAFILAFTETAFAYYVPEGSGWSEGVAFVLIMVILIIRPHGLRGQAED